MGLRTKALFYLLAVSRTFCRKVCGPSPVLVACGVDSRRRAVTAPARTQPPAMV